MEIAGRGAKYDGNYEMPDPWGLEHEAYMPGCNDGLGAIGKKCMHEAMGMGLKLWNNMGIKGIG